MTLSTFIDESPARPAFSVIRTFDGEQVEFGVVDFPEGSTSVEATVEAFWTSGSALVPRNQAAVEVLLAVTA
jgi:hypothetical protein